MRRRPEAFTRVELLCVIFVAILAAGMILPMTVPDHSAKLRVTCVNNLKNIGLAQRIFATDNDGLLPFELSITNGGARELRTNIVAQFQVLSNELAYPNYLICPNRTRSASPAKDFASLEPKNVQFFPSLTGALDDQSSILGGESELRLDGKPVHGLVEIKTNAAITYPKKLHKTKYAPAVLFGDGHVDLLPDDRWPQRLAATSVATNLFIIP